MAKEKSSKDTGLYEKLVEAVKNLPPKAIEKAPKEKTRKGYDTTGYQYQYLVNVCNEILGLSGWGFDYEIVKDSEGIWGEKQKKYYEVSVNLTIWINSNDVKAERKCAGGHKSDLHGDALKGAITNALKKTMAMFGIGKKAYEGTIDDDYMPIPNPNEKQKQKESLENPEEPPKEPEKSKSGWTEKRKNAIEKIIKSHLITADEKDDVMDIFNIAEKESKKGKLSKTTIERMSHWIKSWYGTKENDWKDGEHNRRKLQEESGDLPF